MRNVVVAISFFVFFSSASNAIQQNNSIEWKAHNAEAFVQAKEESKYILFDLEAVWCHWCHVMDATTYQSPDVIELLANSFIAVKADHDARPDLAERYRDYGWPATIIYNPKGEEVFRNAGYISPDEMVAILTRAKQGELLPLENEIALASNNAKPYLSSRLRDILVKRHIDAFDASLGGLALMQKFVDADTIEWDLRNASFDSLAKQRAIDFLDAGIQLIDPEFGGAYQYSTHGDWKHPHYEKIMRTQVAYLRIYSLAYEQLGDPRYLQAAQSVADYLIEFLRNENGGFYTSQDADLVQGTKGHEYFSLPRKERLLRGLPRIDKNQYAAENGQVIEGLLLLFRAGKDEKYLAAAVDSVKWIMRNRRLSEQGFQHGSEGKGLYLADNLYVASALLTLSEISDQPVWRRLSVSTAKFIVDNFRYGAGGLAAAVDNGTPVEPVPQLDQNIHAARYFLRLYRHTKKSSHLRAAQFVMRYLSSENVALSRLTDSGILLVDAELEEAANRANDSNKK